MASENVMTNVPDGAEINIRGIGSDLAVEGVSGAEIRARGDNPRISTENDGQRIIISCQGDCRLWIPDTAKLNIETVGSDAKIKNMRDTVSIGTVGADLTIRDVGSVKIGRVGADLEVKRAVGDVEIGTVGADAKLREIAGNLRVGTIGADALINDVQGSCLIERIGADLVFNLQFVAGQEYQFGVGADALGRIADDSPIRFRLPKNAIVDLRVANGHIEDADGNTVVVIGIGQSEPSIVEFTMLGGKMELVNTGSSFGDTFAAGIEGFLEFPEDFDEMINARISEQIEHLRDQIDRKTEHIRREAERAAERAKGKANRRTMEFKWDWAWPEKPKRGFSGADDFNEKPKRGKPSEPVSDQERLTILRMVENKQITVEEAERLLAALEGVEGAE